MLLNSEQSEKGDTNILFNKIKEGSRFIHGFRHKLIFLKSNNHPTIIHHVNCTIDFLKWED